MITHLTHRKDGNSGFAARRLQVVARLIALSCVCLATWVCSQAASAGGSEATSVSVSANADTTTFDLMLSDGVPAEIFTLANPYRVIVDLPDVVFKLPPATSKQVQGLISAFRYGLFAEGKARVVIDTAGPVKIKAASMTRAEGKGILLKLVLTATDAASFGAGTGATRQAPPVNEAVAAPSAEAAPKAVGQSKPVIVVDPGHGGIDPGAVGAGAISEKAIVLAVAQQLKAALSQGGRYEVKMTRSTDVFVSLDRRLKFSAENDADLFISLHADSIEQQDFAEAIRGA
ncbi:MAG: N-acetylmuramoyl-L-alanine amidase, partial [Hyphomicrobium sp.]